MIRVIKLLTFLFFGIALMAAKCSKVSKMAKKISPEPSVLKKADDVETRKINKGHEDNSLPSNILRTRRLSKDSTTESQLKDTLEVNSY